MARSGTIKLRGGREIVLHRLTQWGTYDGLLEGLPTREMNQRTIDRILADERQRADHPAYLIRPTERLLDYPFDTPYSFGTPARVPGIVCVGEFEAHAPARDLDADCSALTIVWFQSDFALPIDKTVVVKIEAIDWDTHARDCWF
jgi:hypothetical protein